MSDNSGQRTETRSFTAKIKKIHTRNVSINDFLNRFFAQPTLFLNIPLIGYFYTEGIVLNLVSAIIDQLYYNLHNIFDSILKCTMRIEICVLDSIL